MEQQDRTCTNNCSVVCGECQVFKPMAQQIKKCTGCDRLSTEPLSEPHLACCPDSNYQPMAQQTAVEWLVNHWKKLQSEGEKMSWQQVIDITELVKPMEREQIIAACNQTDVIGLDHEQPGGQYYTKTYGNNNKTK